MITKSADKSLNGMHTCGLPKREIYNWAAIGDRGLFMELHKSQVHVDQVYQRTKISMARVRTIAGSFSWPAFGVISVAKREDGTYWAFDGQHRKLAADERDDITMLPCMVFPMNEVTAEAIAFIAANTVRGSVQTTDKFKALLVANDPVAVGIRDLLATTGHTCIASSKPTSVECVAKLVHCYRIDAAILIEIWPLIAKLCDGNRISDAIVGGMHTLQRKMATANAGSLTSTYNARDLLDKGYDFVCGWIQKTINYRGGGDASYAEGILNALNYRRSTKRIPQVIVSQHSDSEV